ncbi:alanine:cation symporter family protein, partial [Georgenia sp. 10Sc9-8]|nr:alanine:cation symporter family protein [Georgenia halotolerans]
MTAFIAQLNDLFYSTVLVGLLVLTGVVMTWRTRAVQLRLFGRMVRHLATSRRGAAGGISSFQAFTIGMATRVGIGNITGVALALVLGGPGSIFWMWVVALVGMATAFAEATLAQLFKVRWHDRTFRGGPAFYLARGLGSPLLGSVFAVLLILAMVVAMPMVQANAIASTVGSSHGVPSWVTAVVVVILTALVVLGGLRGVARVTEVLSPVMALAYLAAAAVVVALNAEQVPQFLADIVAGAFGLREGLAGLAGGV